MHTVIAEQCPWLCELALCLILTFQRLLSEFRIHPKRFEKPAGATKNQIFEPDLNVVDLPNIQ